MYGKKPKGHVSFFCIGEQERQIQKDICMGKGKRTCVILAIGEEERQIQNAHVLSISSKSGDKKKSDLYKPELF